MKNRVREATAGPQDQAGRDKAKRGPRGPYKNYNPKSLENSQELGELEVAATEAGSHADRAA